MIKKFTKFLILICLLCGLPIAGIIIAGKPIENHIEFPPVTHYIQHASFSWTAFIILAILIFFITLSIIFYIIKNFKSPIFKRNKFKFPWWGKTGILLLIFSWIISWTDLDLVADFRKLIFFPLWLSYIIIINALEYQKTGKSIMTENTPKFLLLFPASVLFWWYFEYLNSYVENWSYTGDDLTPLGSFIFSSAAFSTVLPAVISTTSLLLKTDFIKKEFSRIFVLNNRIPRLTTLLVLILSSAGLFCIGIFPEYLFPLLWLSPLLIIVSIKSLFHDRHILSGISKGNWSLIISASLAALMCGLFWEMWNFFSMPKWQYSIPFVNRFRIFEMPLLGYAGYLFFGLLCVMIGEMTGLFLEADNSDRM